MSNFKVGDKVRVINVHQNMIDVKLGDILTVKNVSRWNNDNTINCIEKLEGGNWGSEHFELVKENEMGDDKLKSGMLFTDGNTTVWLIGKSANIWWRINIITGETLYVSKTEIMPNFSNLSGDFKYYGMAEDIIGKGKKGNVPQIQEKVEELEDAPKEYDPFTNFNKLVGL